MDSCSVGANLRCALLSNAYLTQQCCTAFDCRKAAGHRRREWVGRGGDALCEPFPGQGWPEDPLRRRPTAVQGIEGGRWKRSAPTTVCRRLCGPTLNFRLLRHLQGVIDLNPKVPHCTFEFHMS